MKGVGSFRKRLVGLSENEAGEKKKRGREEMRTNKIEASPSKGSHTVAVLPAGG